MRLVSKGAQANNGTIGVEPDGSNAHPQPVWHHHCSGLKLARGSVWRYIGYTRGP